jgi:hypothetical protein
MKPYRHEHGMDLYELKYMKYVPKYLIKYRLNIIKYEYPR